MTLKSFGGLMFRRLFQITIVTILTFALLSTGVFSGSPTNAYGAPNSNDVGKYGVFIGLNSDKISKLYDYDTVIIDAAYYTKSEIKKLHKKGVRVLSYINVGSIESFRSYYKRFEPYTLGDYEGWDDEKWMNVAKKSWQKFIAKSYAKKLAKKGIDGFFVDNCDVYENYKTKKTYNGLLKILKTLKKQKLPIVLNGGGVFVNKLIKNKALKTVGVTGVNQEDVFSKVDYDSGKFKKQSSAYTKSYKKYLKKCKKQGLDVYILEYVKPNNKKLRKAIKKYCKKQGYNYYISSSLELT